jgi:hypothetical protein
LRIMQAARELSFKIQHAFVSCRLFVTTVSTGRVRDDIIGAYAFGLERESEAGRSVLLGAKVTTGGSLRSYLGY